MKVFIPVQVTDSASILVGWVKGGPGPYTDRCQQCVDRAASRSQAIEFIEDTIGCECDDYSGGSEIHLNLSLIHAAVATGPTARDPLLDGTVEGILREWGWTVDWEEKFPKHGTVRFCGHRLSATCVGDQLPPGVMAQVRAGGGTAEISYPYNKDRASAQSRRSTEGVDVTWQGPWNACPWQDQSNPSPHWPAELSGDHPYRDGPFGDPYLAEAAVQTSLCPPGAWFPEGFTVPFGRMKEVRDLAALFSQWAELCAFGRLTVSPESLMKEGLFSSPHLGTGNYCDQVASVAALFRDDSGVAEDFKPDERCQLMAKWAEQVDLLLSEKLGEIPSKMKLEALSVIYSEAYVEALQGLVAKAAAHFAHHRGGVPPIHGREIVLGQFPVRPLDTHELELDHGFTVPWYVAHAKEKFMHLLACSSARLPLYYREEGELHEIGEMGIKPVFAPHRKVNYQKAGPLQQVEYICTLRLKADGFQAGEWWMWAEGIGDRCPTSLEASLLLEMEVY